MGEKKDAQRTSDSKALSQFLCIDDTPFGRQMVSPPLMPLSLALPESPYTAA